MKTECRDAIYNYADEITQRDAALTGEHKEYVCLVLQLLRDQYHEQVDAGETTFTVPDDIAVLLTDECPW
tara:strand:+ start:293 stop:502 length:210 start_codon:yes stop_codon:yes gene_type:complete